MNAQLPLQNAANSAPPWQQQVDELCAAGQFAAALGLILPQLRQGQVDPANLDRAVMCYLDLGDTTSAVGLAEVMTHQWPDLPRAWLRLAQVNEAMGSRAEAIESYKTALRCDPKFPAALHALNKLAPFARGSTKARRLSKLSKSSTVSAPDRALLLNSLGQIEQRAGHAARAFRCYAKSNMLLGGQYNGGAIDALVNAQEQAFLPCSLGQTSTDGPRVIFVCGMPRSGTTLVENILLRHPRITSIGESKALKSTLKLMRERVAARGGGAGYWDWFGKLSSAEIAEFRETYFAQALAGRSDAGPVVVDKMPLNCLDMGAAQMLLPGASFVFLARHPLDTALSNFTTCFSDGMAFSQRLEWIGQLTRSVYRSLDDYAQKLGKQVRVQSYEALVRDPEAQIRALLEVVDLSWEADCLTPHLYEGVVRTASVMQVREGINTNGIGRWKAFEKELQPVVEALGGTSWLEAWKQRAALLA